MRKTFVIILALSLTVGWGLPLFSKSITLVHSNDTHGTYKPWKMKLNAGSRWVGGMKAASHTINVLREKEKNLLLIELGDILTGTMAAEIKYKGVIGGAMMEFLNRLGYDVWCYGNHEFDRGQETALGLARLAKFPTIMANIIYKKDRKPFPAEPYHVFDMDGLKVAITALMEENFLLEVQKEYVESLDVLPIVPTLKSYLPEMDRKSDLIVVLMHGPFDEGLRLARSVEGIDVVLVASEDGRFEKVNGVLVKSTIGHQKTLGYLKLEVEDDRVASYEERLIWLWAEGCLRPSPEVTALLEEIEASIRKEYGKVIGEAERDLSRRNYPVETSPVEIALGNWITDAMRWKTGAQVGFHNSGGIRAGIAAGPVTKEDVFNVYPFHSGLVLFRVTGQQLKDILERDVERDFDRIQVSGLKYRYFPKEAKPFGHRVHFIEIDGEVLVKGGQVLSPRKVYTVVSNDYLVGQAEDKYFGFPVEESKNTGFRLTQVLMEWLEKHKVLDYRIEGRIVETETPR
ncbi:MAG: bifunctional metallophosphatase/5'-nucleotidase [Candidatus Aminicenantales bacterium]